MVMEYLKVSFSIQLTLIPFLYLFTEAGKTYCT